MSSAAIIVMLESISFVSRSAAVRNNIWSNYSRQIVPIRRSIKGWESET
jgi:hypothetical protein